ncbi:(4S)-4-hydroxy-5-phosphonooxypentane-2,3-dione isomerase [Roseobacter fucihabitans]|uniref:(4S)-4-hydroxy-5-phosphonooxypentane-2,3-dione isomerase n=1 Tax=Roseobacter fucihabitans TaxID=1537242 RepID=A0ABZ2BS01_9RHOB|nr:putative quinol monooxygenase [Roseobacter litoralis]MBC6965399.1 Autoinducer 2-degrading protein LsrG [Roseobacter litoralis]
MFAVVVTFSIPPEHFAQFMPLMQQNAATSLADEPGCHRFDIATDPARPDEVFLYELYSDEAAFRAHLSTLHFQAFDKATAAMIAEKSVKTYTSVRQ